MENQSPTQRKVVRTDSWTASLTERQQWEIYFHSKTTDDWLEPLLWAQKEFGLTKMPSRASFYRWRNQLGKCEFEDRLADAVSAAADVKALAKVSPSAKTLTDTFVALAAVELLNRDNFKDASKWIKLAEMFQKIAGNITKAEIFEQDAKIIEGYRDLKRRRFELWRRQHEASEPKRDPPLTPEKLKEELDRMFGRNPDGTLQSTPVPPPAPPIPAPVSLNPA